MRLSRCDLSDLASLLPLVKSYHQFEGIASTGTSRREAVSALLSHSDWGDIYALIEGEQVIGYIALCKGFSIEFGGWDAFIDEFFILEQHRNKGHGTQALRNLLEIVRSSDIQAVHLEVAQDNSKALALYSKLGFELRQGFHLMSVKTSG